MSDPANTSPKDRAVIDLIVVSEIMAVLADSAQDRSNEVPATWMRFLGCCLGSIADRLILE
jgi:hypothetical protein